MPGLAGYTTRSTPKWPLSVGIFSPGAWAARLTEPGGSSLTQGVDNNQSPWSHEKSKLPLRMKVVLGITEDRGCSEEAASFRDGRRRFFGGGIPRPVKSPPRKRALIEDRRSLKNNKHSNSKSRNFYMKKKPPFLTHKKTPETKWWHAHECSKKLVRRRNFWK